MSIALVLCAVYYVIVLCIRRTTTAGSPQCWRRDVCAHGQGEELAKGSLQRVALTSGIWFNVHRAAGYMILLEGFLARVITLHQ